MQMLPAADVTAAPGSAHSVERELNTVNSRAIDRPAPGVQGLACEAEATGQLLSFLEAAIHCVLHSRRVYPPQLFELRKLYGVQVYMARAPALRRYIAGMLSAGQLGMWLRQGQLRQVVLAINARPSSPVERFVFELGPLVRLSRLPSVLERTSVSDVIGCSAGQGSGA